MIVLSSLTFPDPTERNALPERDGSAMHTRAHALTYMHTRNAQRATRNRTCAHTRTRTRTRTRTHTHTHTHMHTHVFGCTRTHFHPPPPPARDSAGSCLTPQTGTRVVQPASGQRPSVRRSVQHVPRQPVRRHGAGKDSRVTMDA
jgi:hypothetical protein